VKRLALVLPFLALPCFAAGLLALEGSPEPRPAVVERGHAASRRVSGGVGTVATRSVASAPTTPTVPPRSGGREDAAPPPSPDPEAIRRGLTSDSLADERAALEAAREILSPTLVPDIERLLERSDDRLVKEIGAQVLALGAPDLSTEVLERLFQDDDPVTRINAAFGLARAGSLEKQEWLLAAYDGSRAEAPLLMPLLGEMLERPEIKADAVIRRYELVANDETLDRDVRERAAGIVRKKREP
jgi:hypothetical protein